MSYDVNVKGLHAVLDLGHAAGVRRVVYLSTGSVHGHRPVFSGEDLPRDNGSVYGFTKALGERVCEWFCTMHDAMTVIALRLWHPVSSADWERVHADPAKSRSGGLCTRDRDVAESILLSLSCEAVGFHPVFIAGDAEGTRIDLSKAGELLGWKPTPWPPAARAEVV